LKKFDLIRILSWDFWAEFKLAPFSMTGYFQFESTIFKKLNTQDTNTKKS